MKIYDRIFNIHHRVKRHAVRGYNFVKKLRNQRSNINILFTTLAIVMIWRGVWGLLDKYLFPNNEILSMIVSIVLGMLILFIDDETLDELSENKH